MSAPEPLVFPVRKGLLRFLTGFGLLIAAAGLIMAGDGLSLPRVTVIGLGLAMAALPYRLLSLGARVTVDPDAGTIAFAPGGESYHMDEIVKLSAKELRKTVVMEIEKPTFGRTSAMAWRYPLLCKTTLSGFAVNGRMLADPNGFLSAMKAFAAAAERRAMGVED